MNLRSAFSLPPLGAILTVFACYTGALTTARAGTLAPPSVELAFSPERMGAGSCSELTITIDHSAGDLAADSLALTLNLPNGVTLATPSGATTDCGGTLTASDGASSLSLSGGAVAAGVTCTIRAAITISAPGPFTITTGDLTSSAGNSGSATATLGVPEEGPVLGFGKSFTPGLVPLGGTSRLTYTIENQGTVDASELSFREMLPPGIVIANPANVSTDCGGAQLTAVPGTRAIVFESGAPGSLLPVGEACTLSLDVVGVSPGLNISTSENLTSSGQGETDVPAGFSCAGLEVLAPEEVANVTFTKEFTTNPIAPGATGTLQFTITNNSQSETLSNISFSDDLNAVLPGLVATEVPTKGGTLINASFDGGGAAAIITGNWNYLDRIENENGLNQGYPLDAENNAWNSVDFDVTSSSIGPWESGAAPLQGGLIDGFPAGTPAVLGGIDAAGNGENLVTTYLFRNTFDLTPEQLGEVDWLLQYLIDDGAIIYLNGTEVFRTPSMPAGLVSTNTLSDLGDETAFATADVPFAGILVEGTNTIAVEVHQAALDSSDVGFALQLIPASEAPSAGFSYLDDPFQETPDPEFSSGEVQPAGGFSGGALFVQTGGQGFFASLFSPQSSGGWARSFTLEEAALATVNLRYRLATSNAYENDEYGEAVLTVDGVRYGSGPDNSLVRFTGDGNGGADFDTGWREATFEIPLSAGAHELILGAYNNKSTSGDEITRTWFDDVVISVPEQNAEVCGPGSSLSGTDTIQVSGGSLGPGQSCTFTVDVTVPVSTPVGTYLNTTSRLTTQVLGDTLTGFPATDTLEVEYIPPSFAKRFTPDSIAGQGVSTLTFTIDNRDSAVEALDVQFNDMLPEGLVIADPPNPRSTCPGGTLTAVAGTSTISFADGSLPAGETCELMIDVTSDTPGIYLNTSSELTSSSGISAAATASLTVNPPPLFSKSFLPASLNAGQVGTLTFTIDNSASTIDATGISFTDNLPAGLVLSDPINFSTTCIGGTVSAGAGSGTFSYSGGTAAAGETCTLTVEVTSVEGGTYVNTTSDLTSSLGNSGPASDTLEIASIVAVTITQRESADPIVAGAGAGNLTYEITAANDGPSTATGVVVTSLLEIPPGVTVDQISPPPGTTFEDSSWNIGSLAAGTSATMTVELTVGPSATAGENVVSSLATLAGVNETNVATGGSEILTETSVLTRVDLQVTNSGSSDTVVAGSGPENLTYLVTVTNNGPSDASHVAITNALALPAGVEVISIEPHAGTTFDSETWTVGVLEVGATAILRLILEVGPSAPAGTALITNTASITSVAQTDVNPQNNSREASTTISREVDLVVTLTDSRNPVVAGFELPGNLRHAVMISNNGPSNASLLEVGLAHTLPALATISEVITPNGTFFEASSWQISDLPRGASATLSIDFNVPAGVGGEAGGILTGASVLNAAETIINPENDEGSVATDVVSPATMTTSAGELALDLQTSLFKQVISITNNNPVSVPAFRLLVTGLPDDVSVHNAQGATAAGSFLLYNEALAPGESVELVAEYFQLDASGGFEPSFELELLEAANPAAVEPGQPLDRIEALPNGDILLEFSSTVGQIYQVQFSHDGENWFNVVPSITAGATVTQWIDNGPPKTPTPPGIAPGRLYRVHSQAADDQ